MQKRSLRLKTGHLEFKGISLENKLIVLAWVAETEVQNKIAVRFISIGWRWPPVKWVTAFTDAG